MDEGRFPPGTLIAQRYRVVSLLGRGGMGEVYRANDLLLGQSVALKFLPEQLAADEALTGRFRNEVRTARMVTHPNVCRVHDLGEAGGRLFLSMEFVDGEDLASLLRRIGRLPPDKGLEIARKLCAGLAAAHEKGVIHRDLKPANVMIDGRGEVVITDFGLAGLSGSIRDVTSGTPAYMAPEQRSGEAVTAQGDIYSLGAVLHEIFTGKRPGESAANHPDLPAPVAAVVERCLDPDPARRPASAFTLARALPGGDPLAAALAAGETPSPEMVAAAGGHAGLRPAVAAVLLAVACTGPLLRAWRADHNRTGASLPPEELMVIARSLVRRSLATEPAHEISGYRYNFNYRSRLSQPGISPAMRKEALWGPQYFWYRSGPLPHGSLRQQPSATLSLSDPPPAVPGMSLVVLDQAGRLIRFETVPDPLKPGPPADWSSLRAAAGLEEDRLEPAGTAGAQSANWRYRDRAGIPYSVSLTTQDGALRRFEVGGEWDRPSVPPAAHWLTEVVFFSVAAAFAWRNFRLGRADPRGALTLGIVLGLSCIAIEFLRGADLLRWNGTITPLDPAGQALVVPALMALTYLAMEPYVRRRWPAVLITWTRLLRGEWKDASVQRDILLGMATFTAAGLPLFVLMLAASTVDFPLFLDPFQGGRQFVAALLASPRTGINRAVMATFLLFVLRLLLRRDWAAGLVFTGIFTLMNAGILGLWDPVTLSGVALIGASVAYLLLRFGILASIACETTELLTHLTQTLDPAVWFSAYSFAAIAIVSALGVSAFRLALGGRKLLSEDV